MAGRGWVRRGVPVGVSTLLAFFAGALTNVFTAGWSWSAGVALVVLVIGWVAWEIRWAVGDAAAPVTMFASAATASNLPSRNRAFTGRAELITSVREALSRGGSAAVQAIGGMGGVGKTQLAIEYAHRFRASYPVTWWVNAEESELIGEQLTQLAIVLGLAGAETDTSTAVQVVRAELRRRTDWLLVFDNARDPAAVAAWLPGGGGHVLITSRRKGWDHLAAPIDVAILTRTESVALVRSYHPDFGTADAGRLAAALGDLPLALVQAASFLSATGAGVDEYLRWLHQDANRVLAEGGTGAYPRTLSAVINLAAHRLAESDPAGSGMLRACGFLAPEPVPVDWFALPGGDAFGLRVSLAASSAYGLARLTSDDIWLHRLTQAVLRDSLSPPERAAAREQAEAVVVHACPGQPDNPATWRRWSRLVPHVLALGPAETANSALRTVGWQAARYLLFRGDVSAGHRIAASLCARLGPDDATTLAAAHELANSFEDQGRYERARDLAEETLTRRTRVLGPEHRDTLHSVVSVGHVLLGMGKHEQARRLYDEHFPRARRALGADHPVTLRLARDLTANLVALGEFGAARQQGVEALARSRRILGEDHPVTRNTARHLANALAGLSEHVAARELGEQVLAQSRRVIGLDHPDTLRLAAALVVTLAALGEHARARELARDTRSRALRVLGPDDRYHGTLAADLAGY